MTVEYRCLTCGRAGSEARACLAWGHHVEDRAAPAIECECCQLPLCERKSPGIGYYCWVCLHHWSWAEDVGRTGARHSTYDEYDTEVAGDHARLVSRAPRRSV